MTSKRKTRSSSASRLKGNAKNRKTTKHVPPQCADSDISPNSQKEFLKENDDDILESLLMGHTTNDSETEVYVKLIGKNKRSKKNTEPIQVKKFQKGRTGKLEFIPCKGNKKPIVFDTKKHKLVQKKKLIEDFQDKSVKEILESDQEETTSVNSTSKGNTGAENKVIKNQMLEVNERCTPLPQEVPERCNKRNKKPVIYKEEEEEESDLEDSENESEADEEESSLSPPSKKSVRFNNGSVGRINEIESAWLDNEEDWRCFNVVDY